MRQLVRFTLLLSALTPSVGHAQIKPENSGTLSFREPELRRHHHGLIEPNAPGRPRVGYHRHHRKYRNPHFSN